MNRRPNAWKVNEPDARDVRLMTEAIAQQFGLSVELRMRYTEEDCEMVGVASHCGVGAPGVTVAQALSRRRLSDKRSRDAQAYNVLWDIYQQLDTGIMGWSGVQRGR